MNLRCKVNKLAYIAGIAASVSLTSGIISPIKAQALTPLFSTNDSFSNAITELEGSPLLTVSRYNPQTGETVTEVRVTLNASLASSGTVTNIAANPQPFTVRTIADQYDMEVSSGPAALGTTISAINSGDFIGSQRYTAAAPNVPQNFGPFSISNSTAFTFTNLTDIQGFLGTGTFSLLPYTLIGTSISGGGGNVRTNISTLASADITVEYFGEATAVPFGFSSNLGIAVFAGTFLGFSWWKRNRHLNISKV